MNPETNGITIHGNLQRLALENPEKHAFIFWDKNLKRTVLTRQDVWDKSRKCASFFRRHGIVKGDVVCNTLVNSQERLISMYGTILAGAVSMHGQKFMADGEDVLKTMEDCQCKFVVIDPDDENGVGSILEKIKIRDDETGKVRYQGLTNLSTVIPIVRVKWLQLLDEEQEMYADDTITEDDVAFIMVTSGSTGFGKVVPHTHRAMAITGCNTQKAAHLRHDSVCLNEDALGWTGGAPIMYPFIGLTRVLMDWTLGFPADYGAMIAHIIETEPCDTAIFVTIDIERVLNHLDAIKKPKLETLMRVIGTSGGPVSKTTMKAIGRMCESISVIYGATEMDMVYSLNVKEPSEYENTCCGYPVHLYGEAKVVDKDLKEVPQGKSGEVLLRGPWLFKGYLNNPEVNEKELLPDGWWRSSDIGHMNEKGQLFVYCRKSHVINYTGYKCYPGWMEAKLDKHPSIKKSYVLGIPHPIEHEEVCLCISKNSETNITAEEAKKYCKTLFLTTDAETITPIPKYVLFFDSFPYKNNGKIDRKALKVLARIRVEWGLHDFKVTPLSF